MAKLALAALVAATRSPLGYLYASVNDAKSLVGSGDAEQNLGAANPTNAKEFATRASIAGLAKQDAIDAKAAASAVPTFSFVVGPSLEKPERSGGRKNKYPFADFPAPTLDANGKPLTAKIFIPATEAMPNPAKSLSSTVSQASRDFATVSGTKPAKDRTGKDIMRNVYDFTRKFAIVAGEQTNADGTVTKGAWIERVK